MTYKFGRIGTSIIPSKELGRKSNMWSLIFEVESKEDAEKLYHDIIMELQVRKE